MLPSSHRVTTDARVYVMMNPRPASTLTGALIIIHEASNCSLVVNVHVVLGIANRA
jgi:hypothetical protein